jgi:O-antigen/teichoic acid export membrane protein
VVSVATGTAGFALVMVGKQRQWLIISAGALAVNIVLNWLLIPRFGMAGAAVTTAVATSLLYLTPLFLLHRLIGLRIFSGGTVRLLAPVATAAGTLTLLNVVHDGTPAGSLLLNGAIGGAVFLGVTLLYAISPDETGKLRQFIESARTGLRSGGGHR